MKTYEEYILNELEALKKENAYLKEQIEWMTADPVGLKKRYEECADCYYEVIKKLMEITHARIINVGGETKILQFYNNFISSKVDKEDYELLEPFVKD